MEKFNIKAEKYNPDDAMDTRLVVLWPESQIIMDDENFDEECESLDVEEYGSAAYAVPMAMVIKYYNLEN